MKHLTLASGSPRRVNILSEWAAQHGWDITVSPTNADESVSAAWSAEQVAEELAARKGRENTDKTVVVAADTIVVREDETILNKPVHGAEARDMLLSLSMRTHRVLTGIYLRYPDGREEIWHETAHVTFGDVAPYLNDYISSGEPFDKAGGYGAQNIKWDVTIDGDPNCVIGLPMTKLAMLLSEIV